MRNPQNRWSHHSKVCFETLALLNRILNYPVLFFFYKSPILIFFQRKKTACRWRKSLSTSTSAHRQKMLTTLTQILNETIITPAPVASRTVKHSAGFNLHSTAGWVKASQRLYQCFRRFVQMPILQENCLFMMFKCAEFLSHVKYSPVFKCPEPTCNIVH